MPTCRPIHRKPTPRQMRRSETLTSRLPCRPTPRTARAGRRKRGTRRERGGRASRGRLGGVDNGGYVRLDQRLPVRSTRPRDHNAHGLTNFRRRDLRAASGRVKHRVASETEPDDVKSLVILIAPVMMGLRLWPPAMLTG